MKKILAIAIVVVMTAALCLTASAIHNPDDTTKVWLNTEECALSFDTFYLNGVSHMDLGWGADGGAHEKLSANPVTVGDNETLTIRGWAGLKEGTVAEFGYKINEGTPVFDSSFTRDAEDPVKAAGGDYRMEIVVPIKGLTAPTLITAVIKGEAGEVVDFIEFSVNGQYEGAPATPDDSSSADKAVLTLDAAKLGELFDGTTGANTISAEVKNGGEYITFTADGDDPFFAFPEPVDVGVDAKYAVIKYRYAGEGERTIDFYLQIAEPHARTASIETDGEWHYAIIDCSAPYPDSMESLWDGTIARFDPLSGNGIAGTSIDIASIAFYTSEADAQAAMNGGQQGGSTNPTTSDASVIAIAAVACVALAGVVVAKKVR